jgi:TPR repeat protein
MELASQGEFLTTLGADMATKGKMREHYRKGASLFMARKYEEAVPELSAATMIVDPYVWKYWYAEAYSLLGVIFEFHRSDPDHNLKAVLFYRLALKNDPKTFTARYFLKRLKADSYKN